MNNIISVSLFKISPDAECHYLKNNLDNFLYSYNEIFPDFDIVLYCNFTNNLLDEYCAKYKNFHIYYLEDTYEKLCKSMLWRLRPLYDLTECRYIFCRDIDSICLPKERLILEEFMASDYIIHNINDHPMHAGIMGGMCGFNTSKFNKLTNCKSLDELINLCSGFDWNIKGSDQHWLNELLLGNYAKNIMFHKLCNNNDMRHIMCGCSITTVNTNYLNKIPVKYQDLIDTKHNIGVAYDTEDLINIYGQ